ncbi:MAG TPA: hypothetical protein VIM51_11810 [Desulfosporosinus sp.]
MAVKVQRIYSEQWNPTEEQINSIFPIDDITSDIGKNPGIAVITDDEVRLKYPSQYNISVQARAYNRGLVELLQKYYEDYRNSPEFAGLVGIQLPQIMWVDTLGFEEKLISLHITKLHQNEIFINDLVLVKNEDFDLLSDGVIDKVLNNLRIFAKEQGAKYLSGYAANRATFNLLNKKGFKEDKRDEKGNDYLWALALQMGEQFPYYEEL